MLIDGMLPQHAHTTRILIPVCTINVKKRRTGHIQPLSKMQFSPCWGGNNQRREGVGGAVGKVHVTKGSKMQVGNKTIDHAATMLLFSEERTLCMQL